MKTLDEEKDLEKFNKTKGTMVDITASLNNRLCDCIDGFIYPQDEDGFIHKVPCPKCAARLKEVVDNPIDAKPILLRNGDRVDHEKLLDMLNIPKEFDSYTSFKATTENIFLDKAIPFLEEHYLPDYLQTLQEIYDNLLMGIAPTKSLLIPFVNGTPIEFIVSCLLAGVSNGLKVTPILTDFYLSELNAEGTFSENTNSSQTIDTNIDTDTRHLPRNLLLTKSDIARSDVCFIFLTMGVTNTGIYLAKSIMETRALANKATIICTTSSRTSLATLTREGGIDDYNSCQSQRIKELAWAKRVPLYYKSHTPDALRDIFIEPKDKYAIDNDLVGLREFQKEIHHGGSTKTTNADYSKIDELIESQKRTEKLLTEMIQILKEKA